MASVDDMLGNADGVEVVAANHPITYGRIESVYHRVEEAVGGVSRGGGAPCDGVGEELGSSLVARCFRDRAASGFRSRRIDGSERARDHLFAGEIEKAVKAGDSHAGTLSDKHASKRDVADALVEEQLA